jgi:two-component system, sensor histidine kinase PdtaS
MATLADRIMAVSDLTSDEAEHLRSLCSSWQVLADLSFSDLLLYVREREDEVFRICAQLRPLTSQTLYPDDKVGQTVTQASQPIVERAFREGKIWSQGDPVLLDGIPIRMDAVPVRHQGRITAVVTKEGSPAAWRRPGRLEEMYLQAADRVSRMIAGGYFPLPGTPPGDWPRIGEGLFILDGDGTIAWASPNALSSLHRLGIRHNALGHKLDALGVGQTPVAQALKVRRVMDGELVRGDTHVRICVMPLVEDDKTTGVLLLSRDVTELRQKERLISVRDATIREIHHRVKNNLQTIASLLRLQARRVSSEESRDALQESVLRIGSIALVHETLSEVPTDLAEFGEVARRIADMVSEGLVSPDRAVTISVEGKTGLLGSDLATPLAVTVAELIQNAVEHAFPGRDSGSIRVEMSRDDSEVVVVVSDDGVGIRGDLEEGARLGLQIVRSLIRELGGSMRISVDTGTRAEVRVPAGEEIRP